VREALIRKSGSAHNLPSVVNRISGKGISSAGVCEQVDELLAVPQKRVGHLVASEVRDADDFTLIVERIRPADVASEVAEVMHLAFLPEE
jgi:hypothetical protein